MYGFGAFVIWVVVSIATAVPGIAGDGGVVREETMPETFVRVRDVAPDIIQDIRFAGAENFVGEPIDGYRRPVAILTRVAAEALRKAQKGAVREGLLLKIYDAYRPQRAVDRFMRWIDEPDDPEARAKYYPNITSKQDLVADEPNYIAKKSFHTHGCSVDITLVDMRTGEELDMGGEYLLFDPRSFTESPDITCEQKYNRLRLRLILERLNFRNYKYEWWHFDFDEDLYPDGGLDFPVE